MAKFLREILDAKEPHYTQAIRQLEALTGRKAVDVAYTADIMARAHAVMRQLGLDPKDTKPLELYKALTAQQASSSLFSRTDDVALIVEGHVISFNHEDITENIAEDITEICTATKSTRASLIWIYTRMTKFVIRSTFLCIRQYFISLFGFFKFFFCFRIIRVTVRMKLHSQPFIGFFDFTLIGRAFNP